MASVAAWLPFARAAAIGWAPIAREFNIFYLLYLLRTNVPIVHIINYYT